MKYLLSGILALSALICDAQQHVLDWDGKYQLQLSDFMSPATEIGPDVISLQTGASIDFAYHNMTQGEFTLARNFNSRVNCRMSKDAASIVAPDSATALNLVKFARFEFDLSELYARKFRQRVFNEKDNAIDAAVFQPIYNDIQREFNIRQTNASKETQLGQNQAALAQLHADVLTEINQLSEFCKECKPKHRKRQERESKQTEPVQD